MTLFNLLLLAVVQGITEFLPISSSAHLVLIHAWSLGPKGDALALDVAVHLGSIAAVSLYFRQDVLALGQGAHQLLRNPRRALGEDLKAQFVLALLLATLPAVVVGAVLIIADWAELLRDQTIIGATMIGFGVLLWWAHRFFPETRQASDWTFKDAFLMGLWQALALVPGVSRSGVTLTAARMLGFERHEATRLAMLMSIPITMAVGGALVVKLARAPEPGLLLGQASVAAVFAFAAAYAALAVMMRLLRRVSFTPYVIYRIVLGVVLLTISLE